MPDDRFIHPRLGHNDRVHQLSWFERCVWLTYLLAADDFGVMRYSAVTIREADDKISEVPERKVEHALDRILSVGLIKTFTCDRRVYCFHPEWQNYQRVRRPRATLHPMPPADLLATCTHATRALFGQHQQWTRTNQPQDFGNVPATPPSDFGNVATDCPPAVSRLPLAGSRLPLAVGERAVDRPNLRIQNQGDPMPLWDWQFAKFRDGLKPKFGDDAWTKTMAWVHQVGAELTDAGVPVNVSDPVKWWDARYAADWGAGAVDDLAAFKALGKAAK